MYTFNSPIISQGRLNKGISGGGKEVVPRREILGNVALSFHKSKYYLSMLLQLLNKNSS